MEIEIRQCNNIAEAKIFIEPCKLNIKFAPNGTGKSTISKAIQFASAGNEQALTELLPFNLRDKNPGNVKPEVRGVQCFRSVKLFNEDYVSQFTFKPEELVSNSFDIFIRTDAYRAVEADIKEFVKVIQQQFTDNFQLDSLISDLVELSSAFKVTASGGLSKSSSGMRGLSGGNKLLHIPIGLEPYQPFIQSPTSVNWIDWQSKGYKDFSDISDVCPFCAAELVAKKEQIAKVSQEYDKNLIKSLVGILNVIEKLGEFLSDEARENLNVITSLKDGIGREHEEYIVTIKAQIDILTDKLEKVRALSGFDFKEGESVHAKLPTYKIDLQFLSALNSEKTLEAISAINRSIDGLVQQAGPLQGKINIQRREMGALIERHQKDINDFLAYAGYRYEVAIVGEGERSQLKLRHVDNSDHLSGGSQHLSFGERNAFSIVLFMYACLADKPDLIILDDPISSFDKNKKYAILEMLFRRDAGYCLKGKTVLILTHDVEPIIDTLKSVKGQFSNQVSAKYLYLRSGVIVEKNISGNDIKTFIKICETILQSDHDPIIKLIYLRRRYEVLGELDHAYQVLSNLFKKRVEPEDHRVPVADDGSSAPLSSIDISAGVVEIQSYICGIPADYQSLVGLFTDEERIIRLYHQSTNGYEKLQLTRILLGDDTINSSVIKKFINEAYHIENEFIFQLDPSHFDLIPEYVVKQCDKIVQGVMG